jgi:TetR/AcrR family transcriptional regulator, cholesterol catabolism regulator
VTEDTADTSERIRQAAASLFRTLGFNGTSMADLAAAVGVTKSSLYHHFSSKQALLAEILELTMERVAPHVQEVAESDMPAADRLHRVLVLHTTAALIDMNYVACFIEEGRYLATPYMEAHLAKRDRYERYFRQILEDGVASGEFVPQDSRVAAMALLGMCNAAVKWYRPKGDHSPEEIARQFADLAVRGVSVASTVAKPVAETAS